MQNIEGQRQQKEDLAKRFQVRTFKTTTESIVYTQKLMSAMSGLKMSGVANIENMEISELATMFDPELIKYVITNFVSLTDQDQALDYESEFIGDIGSLMMVFNMAIEHLSKKANGEGKSQGTKEISSKKR